MNERAPLPRTSAEPEPGPALVFAPHSDDDLIGPGGAAALHVRRGDRVRVVVVFDGLAGDPDGRYEPEELRALRRREALAGGAHLGLVDYEFWDYPEGHEPGPDDLLAAAWRVVEVLKEVQPRQVYAPWIGEHHLDHHTTARLVRLGLELAGFEGAAWGYEVWTPLVPTWILDISPLYEAKVAALREHTSQLVYTDHIAKTLGMQAHRSLYLSGGSRYGEAFAPLGPASEADRALAGLS